MGPRAGLEYQSSEAFQGEVWRGRGVRDVEKPNEFIAFPQPPGSGLWAVGMLHRPWIIYALEGFLHPSKTYGFHRYFDGSGNAPWAPEPARSVNN